MLLYLQLVNQRINPPSPIGPSGQFRHFGGLRLVGFRIEPGSFGRRHFIPFGPGCRRRLPLSQ